MLRSPWPRTDTTQTLRKTAQSKRVELDALKLRRKGAKPEQAAAVRQPRHDVRAVLQCAPSSLPLVANSCRSFCPPAQLDEQVAQAQLAYDTAMQEALTTVRNVIQSVWLPHMRRRRPTARANHSAAALCWRRAAGSRSRWPSLRTL